MNKRAKSSSIRIIAGQWRGRRVPVVNHHGLRPTTDRVRETLFNWLAADIVGARCLDLFAGSGAIGLECLSRGAAFVQFVEADRKVSLSIQQALDTLLRDEQGSRADVVTQMAEILTSTSPTQPFDIVFLDPPFDSDLLNTTTKLLEQNGWLSATALIYIECNAKQVAPKLPDSWQSIREKVAGQCRYSLYSRSP